MRDDGLHICDSSLNELSKLTGLKGKYLVKQGGFLFMSTCGGQLLTIKLSGNEAELANSLKISAGELN